MWRYLLIAALWPALAAPQTSAISEAVVALQHQDYKAAEQKLRAELKLHPNDAQTLSLLGVALDEQRRFPEATEFHKRAIASSPRSTGALYNYANNLLATRDEKGAREVLLKAVALDPADHNANLALAQLALNRKDGQEALVYLDRLKGAPETAIMRLIALDLAGNSAEAGTLFQQLSAATQNDGKLSAEEGWAMAKAGQFDQAETFLTHALAADPSNFQILYSLGVTASQAGHNERAQSVLQTALRQKPDNVDTLYALALVDSTLAQNEAAIRLLAQAARLDTQRADVQKLLAIAARNIKADEDSVAAWDRYLKLMPGDDEARRERAFGKARLALLDEALPELTWFTTKHPDDAMGFYELGMAESVDDPEKAIASMDRAVALKPDLLPARAGRGILLYTENRPADALADLEFAASKIPPDAPERATMLDRLGQAYVALNRLADAMPVLRKAAELAPGDSTVLLHLANALAEAGQTEESDTLMARFREMRPGGRTPKVSGVVDYLSMTPEQRRDLYRTRLEKTIGDRPEDVNSRILYLKYLLSDNRMPEAAATASKIAELKPGAAALAESGHALLLARQYSPAKALLEQAAKADPSPGTRLDLAVATFHAGGSAEKEGLRQLDLIPESARDGEYYVARAEMLDAAGKPADAMAAMEQALHAAPDRPDSYWQAAALMWKNHRVAEALELLDRAAKAMPGEAQIPAIQAILLQLSGKPGDAQRTLSDAQRRWPEVAAVWVAQGLVLAAGRRPGDARKALETAVTLGAHSPETWFALADSAFRSGPQYKDAAEAAIGQAMKAAPDDADAKVLAGRIAAQTSDFDPANLLTELFLTRPPHDW